MAEYDPNQLPDFEAANEFSLKHGFNTIQVICDGGQLDNLVTFCCCVKFIPQIGSRIILQNGTKCDVVNIIFNTNTAAGVPVLIPTVYACPEPLATAVVEDH